MKTAIFISIIFLINFSVAEKTTQKTTKSKNVKSVANENKNAIKSSNSKDVKSLDELMSFSSWAVF